VTDFAAVDAGDARELVAMMDATDAWPAVRAARAWVLDEVDLDDDAVVIDAGCGTGTFGGLTRGHAVDVDRSQLMLQETRRRRADARTVLGDLARLPVRDGAARLVRVERVLQWVDDPRAALAELLRVAASGGWLAVTDTDWGTFDVDHPDEPAATRLRAAALTWVPHARFARDLPSTLAALGALEVRARHDTFAAVAWDPDDPAQHDGPPGLPLHSIAPEERDAIDALAERARRGRFAASVTLVTCIARTPA
jgi:SAM-dependent methyltransferase